MPRGKHALYSMAAASNAGEEALPPENPLMSRGPVVVECSTCGAESRVGLLDLLLFQLPVGFWLPRGRFDRWMTCPACRRRVWASVTLRRR